MIGIGEVTLPDRGSGHLGAVAAQDFGEHRDRLALISLVRATRRELPEDIGSGAVPADALVPVQLRSRTGAGGRVGGLGRGGERECEVGVGATGHGGVQPLAVFASSDQGDPGVHGGALRGVPGDRVREVG